MTFINLEKKKVFLQTQLFLHLMKYYQLLALESIYWNLRNFFIFLNIQEKSREANHFT